jgi:drug/metabolite transporter (DMT)-like permease
MWAQLIALGLLFYAATQGAQFLGLAYLPAITVNLILSFTSIIVALLGIVLLAERPTILQWVGVILSVMGAGIYFSPVSIPAGQAIGFVAVVVGVLANAGSSLLGRQVNRGRDIQPIGAVVLLATGALIQGLPRLGLTNWAIIVWLAVVNTAFAFTLWNHTLRTLSAMQSSIINNTMVIQIPILAWLFLGERLTWQEGIGLALVGFGTLIVQLRRS